ncbi:30S ribosomal protein S8e [Candidatus Woesearchaeota archaeon]|nr:30S ribosomal protein S8e [Candidatus Woesearchaeota archaeon]MBW3017166.1 30S ribosomal protein S8e [Candidatus Woesearchaeota archaeon]
MPITQYRGKRKPSGGRLKTYRLKRIYEIGNRPTHTTIGARRAKQERVRTGIQKIRLLKCDVANVMGKDGKAKIAKIKTVVENTADPQLVRRNVFNKGAVIDTELGRARITNRPGQEGTINAKLL